jgi:hypothetical protein
LIYLAPPPTAGDGAVARVGEHDSRGSDYRSRNDKPILMLREILAHPWPTKN